MSSLVQGQRGPGDGVSGDGATVVGPEVKGMAAVGTVASISATLAPRLMMRIVGIDPDQVSPAAVLGWRLFAIRTTAICGLALRGNETARDLFLPVQALDQISWWELYRRGEISLRPTLTLAAISGVIVALDLRRRARR